MGMFLYKRERINESDGNVMFQVIGCIYNGVEQRLKGHFNRLGVISNNEWIDGSADKYSESFIHDVSAFLKVWQLLKILSPLEPFLILAHFSGTGIEAIYTITVLLGTIRSNRFKLDFPGISIEYSHFRL